MRVSWAAALLLLAASRAAPEDLVLDYCCRYNHQIGEPDHLMHAIEVSGGRAIVAGNRGLALIDLDALPASGSGEYLDRLSNLNARDVYDAGGGVFVVNLHRGESFSSAGFATVRLTGNDLVLLATTDETGVLYEKMWVEGSLLFVAAHSHGIRIYTIADPSQPSLVSRLDGGFTDAFAVAVENGIAYVADGAGGLKRVDVSNPAAPILIDGETVETAVGTAEDIVVGYGRVFIAAGGAGIAIYEDGDPLRRTQVEIGGCAESLGWLGGRLVAGNLQGFAVLDAAAPGTPEVVVSEIAARRGPNAQLRICSGVAGGSGDRILCANWNYMDVYRLRPIETGQQADITPEDQRFRFPPAGGSFDLTIRNDGARPLVISSVGTTASSFTAGYAGGAIPFGEAVTFPVTYDGSPEEGNALLRLHSNDPDEGVLAIQLFGNTPYLDPGEVAYDFALPMIRRDPDGEGFVEESFRLSDHLGKIIWFQVYASW